MKEVKNKDRLMSIDSSINNLGLAIWEISDDGYKLLLYKLVHPKVGSRNDEYEKSWSLLVQLKEWIVFYKVNKVILEVPTHWAVSGFEARESGGMAKLSFVCGLIYSLREHMTEFKVVTPQQWKGQLPKDVVVNRLRDHYLSIGVDLEKLNNNIADAIGIGHYYITGSV